MLQRNPLANIPLLFPAAAFIAGIICGRIEGALWFAATAAVAATCSAMFGKHHMAVLIGAICLGCVESILFIPDGADADIAERQITATGVITTLKESDTSQSATVRIDGYGADTSHISPCRKFPLHISVPGFTPSLSLSDRITFRADIHEIAPHRDLPDEIDYADFLQRKHIFMSATVPADDIYSVKPEHGILHDLSRTRAHITAMIYRSGMSTGAKEFINTALLGDASGMPDDTRMAFTASGLSHILALSGLHVGIVALLVTIGLYPLYISGYGKWRALFVIAALWIYAAITGLSPSVTRAVIMMSVLLIGRLLQRHTSPVNSLCFAALIILVADPASLFTIGFQLSFSAVLAILLFAEALNPISRRKRVAYNLFSFITVSASAMLGTALISAIYFHSLPVYFLISNILITLMLPPLLGCALVFIALSALGFDAIWLCRLISLLYTCIEHIASWIASLPGATIDNIYIPSYTLIPYSLSLISLKFWLSNKKPLYALSTLAAVLATAAAIQQQADIDHTPTLYISRDTYHTDLVYYNGTGHLTVITTAPHEANAIMEKMQFRLQDFMQKRNITSIHLDSVTLKSDNRITLFNKTIAILHGKEPTAAAPCHADYALVSRGYRKSIGYIHAYCSPDTILLSADLHPKRLRRYADECTRSGIPYISLKERGWSLRNPGSDVNVRHQASPTL